MLGIVAAAFGGLLELSGRRGQYGLWQLLWGIAGAWLAGSGMVRFFREQKRIQKNLYEVTIDYQGKQETVTALLDTGNQLYEPYGHRPVHVIGREAASRLWDQVDRVIYIPFSAVGTGTGVLPAIQADRMIVKRGTRQVACVERPWLAVSRDALGSGSRYEMLLHGEETSLE